MVLLSVFSFCSAQIKVNETDRKRAEESDVMHFFACMTGYDYREKIGKIIAELRQNHGLTQSQLADRIVAILVFSPARRREQPNSIIVIQCVWRCTRDS